MAKKKKPKREPKGKRKSSEKTGHNKAPTGSELSVVGIGAGLRRRASPVHDAV